MEGTTYEVWTEVDGTKGHQNTFAHLAQAIKKAEWFVNGSMLNPDKVYVVVVSRGVYDIYSQA